MKINKELKEKIKNISDMNAEELENYHETREKVFEFPWYEIVPPTVDEFEQARIQAQTSRLLNGPGVGRLWSA